MSKPKLLKVAIENRHWDLAAHALVLVAVRTRIKENNGKKRSPKGQPERQ